MRELYHNHVDQMFGTPWESKNHVRRAILAAKQDCRCWYCGNLVAVFESQWEPHFSGNWYVPIAGHSKPVLEHVVPRRHGGKSGEDNIVLACWACNSRKAHRSVEEFRLWGSKKMGGARVVFWGERLARRRVVRGELQ